RRPPRSARSARSPAAAGPAPAAHFRCLGRTDAPDDAAGPALRTAHAPAGRGPAPAARPGPPRRANALAWSAHAPRGRGPGPGRRPGGDDEMPWGPGQAPGPTPEPGLWTARALLRAPDGAPPRVQMSVMSPEHR